MLAGGEMGKVGLEWQTVGFGLHKEGWILGRRARFLIVGERKKVGFWVLGSWLAVGEIWKT